ncbi:MAG TPA: peptidoglycan bridge formation glycyltransferase FemA/FemB family protein [Candidatus Limnocylindrales bacterium]
MADATVRAEPTDDWDRLAVDRAGGHVYQSRAWAAHRARSGWQPRFVSAGDLRILALVRPWPLIGGGSAYLPKGPAPVVEGERLGEALWATTKALAAERIDVVAADAEVPASDAAYATWLRRARFTPIEEIHPARHRMSLPLASPADEDQIFGGIDKSTRQRIRKAEKDGTRVERHDARAGANPGEGFAAPAEPTQSAAIALDAFYDLLVATGERLDFTVGRRADYLAWWSAALAAGHLVYLRASTAEGEELAGLLLYRHGGRLTTVHSGDRAEHRKSHPGALHLLRWRAIQLAIRERCREMDLGGVDVPGARDEPRAGDPMYGLYQHKRSFGARWLQLTGAHERVVRPRRYLAGRVVSRALRAMGRSA